jgi:hypothetical protein
MKRKAYSRGERKEMIMNEFYKMVGAGLEPYATAYEMARYIGLNSAQHVRGMMDEMVIEGLLTFWQITHRPGLDKKVYCPFPLIPHTGSEQRIEPKIKFHGKEMK